MGIPKEKQYRAYAFRHTWGTVAQNDCGATIDEVAFAMNHSHGRAITRGYIKLDFSPAWELNAKVIDFIFFSTARSKQGMARDVDERKDVMFRIAPKYMVYARAYFRGEVNVKNAKPSANALWETLRTVLRYGIICIIALNGWCCLVEPFHVAEILAVGQFAVLREHSHA